MNAMLDLLRVPGKKAFSASKIAFLYAGIPFVGILSWLVAPGVFTLLASAVPNLWICIRSSAAPPYLFIVVNFIILTIWKLSENRSERESAPDAHPGSVSVRSRDLASSPAICPLKKSPPEDLSDKTAPIPDGSIVLPDSESSCITAESVEKSTASSNSPESALKAEDEPEVNDSLEDTWNAIMVKSSRSASPPPQAMAKNEQSQSNDEMNRLFDDFIKKNYDQIRLRRNQPSRIK